MDPLQQEIYNIENGVKEVIIVHKKGLDEKPMGNIAISGTIESVSTFLSKRIRKEDVENGINEVFPGHAHILINREDMQIRLIFNEVSELGSDSVTGQLTFTKQFKDWGINAGTEWSHDKFAEFCKMNRSSFYDPQDAMKLFSELKNIRIKTDTAFLNKNDNRGNIKSLVAQDVIDSNIPHTFVLGLPIFKGQPKRRFEVEVYVSPSTFTVTLVSPEINDYIIQHRDEIIDAEIDKIEAISSDIPIIFE